ncbi:MAG: serine/threonine protein kinase, partial [Caldilineaceae bacterium]|nr:serine/threonine protein kinase [Caldilineaceae bacterium]
MTSFSDRYTHIEKVAEGSFGDVYRAQDTQPRRPVAIKVLKERYANDAGALHRLRAEAERTVTVNHPNVVTVLETGETETGMPYIVMEWMEGETLAAYQARCSDGKLTYSDMLRIVKQVGAGLTAAHAKGVLHRDIKPANILLSHGDQVAKLSDFGLAAALDGGSISQGSYQSIVGSAGYLAPEITEGGDYT